MMQAIQGTGPLAFVCMRLLFANVTIALTLVVLRYELYIRKTYILKFLFIKNIIDAGRPLWMFSLK